MASQGARDLNDRLMDEGWHAVTQGRGAAFLPILDSALSPLVEALRELVGSPVTFSDERVSYEELQINTATLKNALAILARWSPASTKEKP